MLQNDKENIECYKKLKDVVKFLKNVIECYRMLQNVIECYRMLENVKEYYGMVQNVKECDKNVMGCFRFLFIFKIKFSNVINVIESCRILQDLKGLSQDLIETRIILYKLIESQKIF